MTIDRAYHEFYSNWYGASPKTSDRAEEFYLQLLAPYLPQDHNASILDVGAGVGMLLRALKNRGFENVHGVEINPEQQAGAREMAPLIDVTSDTPGWLTERSAQFDLLLCIDVIEHIKKSEQIRFVQALRAALRKGGTLICTVPNANSSVFGRWRYSDYTHEIAFTEHSLKYLLNCAGFNDIAVHESPVFQLESGNFRPLKTLASNVARVLSRAQRRIDFIAEFGVDEGSSVPLSVNLLATARF